MGYADQLFMKGGGGDYRSERAPGDEEPDAHPYDEELRVLSVRQLVDADPLGDQ